MSRTPRTGKNSDGLIALRSVQTVVAHEIV